MSTRKPQEIVTPRLLTIPETAEALGLSRRSKNAVYRLIASGELKAVTMPKGQRIDVRDLEDFIERRKRVA